MAMQFLDGFDHYSVKLDKWDALRNPSQEANIVTSEGRFTPGALKIGGGSMEGDLVKFIPANNEYICGFALRFPSDTFFNVEFQTASGGALVGRMTVNAPDITLHDASGATVATALSAVTAVVWQFIEFRCKQSATLGELEVRVGGVTKASAINQNTGGTVISEFNWDSNPTSANTFVDDLYILDTDGSAPQNTFLGDTRITVLRPKADGTNNQFTPTPTSSNFQAVDETQHDADTTFVEAGQIGAKEDYDNTNFVDLGIAPGTIFGVQVVNAAKKTDAGQLKYKDQMRIGGTLFDDGTEVIATSGSYKMTTFIRDTDPSDSAAWTEAKVAATGSAFEITFREV